MKKNRVLGIIVVILVIIALILLSTFVLLYSNDNFTIKDFNNENNNRQNLNNKSQNYEEKVIGTTSYGQVTKLGPFGNFDSDVKIAYIIGVHPMESVIHNIFLESIINKKDLNYIYYVYKVDVTQDVDDYEKSRMNGQLLANNFIVEDAVNNDFDLIIDVHSNSGNWEKNQFIFAPTEKGTAKNLALNIAEQISWLSYYFPPNPTSLEYLTIPLNEKGIPALVFEEYTYSPIDMMEKNINELISVVDNLVIK